MFTILILYAASGLLLCLIAIPLYLQKIPPNGLYGFRIRKTLESPAIWYAVNRYSARWLIFSGLLTSAAAVALYFWPGLSLDAYALGCLGVFAGSFGVGIGFTIRYMHTLPE